MARKGKAVTIWVPTYLLKAIDQVRGNISRSSFIVWLIEEALKMHHEPKKTVLRFVKKGSKTL